MADARLNAGGSIRTSDIPTELTSVEREIVEKALQHPVTASEARLLALARWQTVVNIRQEQARPSAVEARRHARRVQRAARALDSALADLVGAAGQDVLVRLNINIGIRAAAPVPNFPLHQLDAFRSQLSQVCAAADDTLAGVSQPMEPGPAGQLETYQWIIFVLADAYLRATGKEPSAYKGRDDRVTPFVKFLDVSLRTLGLPLPGLLTRQVYETLAVWRDRRKDKVPSSVAAGTLP